MAFHHGPRMVGDELIFWLDAGIAQSYPKSGTTWTEIISSELTGSVSASDWNNKKFTLDGTNMVIQSDAFDVSTDSNKSFSFWFRVQNKETYLFNRGGIFSTWVCKNGQLTVRLRPSNDNNRFQGLTANNYGLFKTNNSSNNSYSYDVYGKDLRWLDGRWFLTGLTADFPISYGESVRTLKHNPELIVFADLNGWVYMSSSEYPYPDSIKSFQYTYGTGAPETHISRMRDVDADEDYVYWCDTTNDRIVKANWSDGTYVTHSYDTTTSENYGICQSGSWVYTLGGDNYIRKRYKSDLTISGSYQATTIDYGIDTDDQGYLYYSDVGEDAIVKLDVDTFSSVDVENTDGTPRRLVVSGSKIFLQQLSPDAICVYDTDLNFLYSQSLNDSIDSNRYKSNYMYGVRTMATGNSGSEEVTYSFGRNNFYQMYRIIDSGSNLEWLGQYSVSGATGLSDTYNAIVDGDFIYACLQDQHIVYKFNRWTNVVTASHGTYHSPGSTDDLLDNARGLAVDDKYLYISDFDNNRIKAVDKWDMTYVTESVCDNGYGLAYSGSLLWIKRSSTPYSEVRYAISSSLGSDLAVSGSATSDGSAYSINLDGNSEWAYTITAAEVAKIHKHTLELSGSNNLTTTFGYDQHPDHRSSVLYGGGQISRGKMFVGNGYGLRIFDTETLGHIQDYNLFQDNITTNYQIANDELINFTIVFNDDMTIILYINGVETSRRTLIDAFEYNTSNELPIEIGKNFDYGDGAGRFTLNQDLYSIMVHDKSLTAAEVLFNYEGLRPRYAKS